MSEPAYPLHVILEAQTEGDEFATDTIQVHGPFREPGALWRWASREGFLNTVGGFRADLNDLIRATATRGWRAIKMALDDWAIQDLEAYECADVSRARVLRGNAAWREWQMAEENDDRILPPPTGWRVAGPVQSCGCEDWPYCVHADDYFYVL